MPPELYGLILTGGQSLRMGRDKSEICYHDTPQWQFLGALLEEFCTKVFWSCTADQKAKWDLDACGLVDRSPGRGPAGGLLTAFELHPNKSWLVAACDYPYLSSQDLRSLVSARAGEATAFRNPSDGLPEPLLAIWEPAAQEKLRGKTSPRDALRRTKVTLVRATKPSALENVNCPLRHGDET